MIISIDTTQPVSAEDRAILAVVLGNAATQAPTKKAAKKAAAAPPAEDLTETPTDQAGDTAADEPDEEVKAAALARASELLSSGEVGRARVMDALKAAGAPKVSAIPGDKIASFLAALTD